MRAALLDSAFVGSKSEFTKGGFTGITLGYDYAAEHEWGIAGIRSKFGITKTRKKLFGKEEELLGYAAYKINKNVINHYTTTLDDSGKIVDKPHGDVDNTLVITSDGKLHRESHLDYYMKKMFHDEDLNIDYWTAWGAEDFIIIMKLSDLALLTVEELIMAFKRKDIAIFIESASRPFAGSGLAIAIYSRLCEASKQEAKENSRKQIDLNVRRDALPAYIAWQKANEAWKKLNASYDSPWDAISFTSTRELDDGTLHIWLNPSHQQHLSAGWLNEADIWDWVNGIPGKVIKSKALWDELNWMGTQKYTFSIGYNLHHMNMYPAEYLLSPGQVYQPEGIESRIVGTGFPKKMQVTEINAWGGKEKKISPDMIKAVEGHIKYKLLESMNRQLRMGETLETILSADRECLDEIFGFMECLRKLGLETARGACNTPQVRENFAWWMDLLKDEALWEFRIKHGLAYEPWVQNGYAEFTKERYEAYKKHKFHDQDEEYVPLVTRIRKKRKSATS